MKVIADELKRRLKGGRLVAKDVSQETLNKASMEAFVAGFICAGGNVDEGTQQAKQYVSCVNACRT